jgi:hypothetical protein
VRAFVTLSKAMVITMTSFYDRMHIDLRRRRGAHDFRRHVRGKATDFDLSPETAEMLYESGVTGCDNLPRRRRLAPSLDFEEYK